MTVRLPLCSRVARPELHSITQPLTISLLFPPTQLDPRF